jgi:integrase
MTPSPHIWHSLATRIVYQTYLNKWIRPYWAGSSIYSLRTIDVEGWLRSLRRTDGELLADPARTAAFPHYEDSRIGWHTFRQTYSTLLIANGKNLKVVQELMRHATGRSSGRIE